MNLPKTTNRAAVTAMGVVAVAVIATAASSLLPEGANPSDKLPRDELSLAAYEPILVEDGTIKYQHSDLRGIDNVASIGTSKTGLVVTSLEEGLGTVYFVSRGELVSTHERISGIALVDASGTLTAWIEKIRDMAPGQDAPEGVGADSAVYEAVAADAETGQIVDRVRVAPRAQVMAVSGDTIALSDGDSSHLWTPGGGAPEVASYVPDDFYIVGLADDRVIASDLGAVTRIYTKKGVSSGEVSGMISWDVSTDGASLAGATTAGDVLLVDLETAATDHLDPKLVAATASYGDGGAVVAHSRSSLTGHDQSGAVSVCRPDEECELGRSEGVPYLPNEALSQLVSQSH